MSALMLGSWSELPLSVQLCQGVCLEWIFGGNSCLRTTTSALEAASEMISEES
jgi:hypothetical protein